ncbi:MAG: DUF72 domain-containing protein [Anaerolineae bacterium]|nr:DUF72 domain-containing protein [Gemmatimonadaceae bacterium]
MISPSLRSPIQSSHDPGAEAAREHADEFALDPLARILPHAGGEILVGTASWTDPTITAPGVFYPREARTAETRLRYYSSRFPVVEVDSSYYALPTRGMAELWAERTPPGHVFDVKAHAVMTGHPTEPSRLPGLIREMLPADLAAKRRVYPKELGDEVRAAIWGWFLDALEPLREAGKLGSVLLQYPPWFTPTGANAAELRGARERLGEVRGAVEFRRGSWLSARLQDRTFGLLRDLGLTYVIVDEPQGMESSVPLIPAVTSPELAIFRMHGHRAETWEKPGVSAVERYRYLYDSRQLEQLAPAIITTAHAVEHVHVLFNNCYANYGTTNAAQMAQMLREWE